MYLIVYRVSPKETETKVKCELFEIDCRFRLSIHLSTITTTESRPGVSSSERLEHREWGLVRKGI